MAWCLEHSEDKALDGCVLDSCEIRSVQLKNDTFFSIGIVVVVEKEVNDGAAKQ